MKALIITMNRGSWNYGNRLQNYAAMQILKKYDLDVETLCFEVTIMHYIKLRAQAAINKLTKYKLCKSVDFWKYEYPRTILTNRFDKKYIPMRFSRDFQRIATQYDYFFVGSDQVWNPKWWEDTYQLKKNAYLLTFADDNKKGCMAPSFSLQEVPDEWKAWFAEHLKKFTYLSVRETRGAEIIKELCNKEAITLVDPTLMLSREEWDLIASKPKGFLGNEYVLSYFLGEQDLKQATFIKTIKDKTGMNIISLLSPEIESKYTIGPSEFVYLVKNASIVITDSFHACVFSLIYGKPFYVCDRIENNNNMSSRIDTFLDTFRLKNRRVGDGNIQGDIIRCDYSEAYKILEDERLKALDYFHKVINKDE